MIIKYFKFKMSDEYSDDSLDEYGRNDFYRVNQS